MTEPIEKISVPLIFGPMHGTCTEFPAGHMETMQRSKGCWIVIEPHDINWTAALKSGNYGPEDFFEDREKERKFFHTYKPVHHGDLHGHFYWILEHDPDCQCEEGFS